MFLLILSRLIRTRELEVISDIRGIFVRFLLRPFGTGRVPLFLLTVRVHSGPDTWSAMHTMPGFIGAPTNHSFYIGPG